MTDADKNTPTASHETLTDAEEDVESKMKTNPTREPTQQHRLADLGIPPRRNNYQSPGTAHTTSPKAPELKIARVEGITAEIEWQHTYVGAGYHYEIKWWSDETDKRSDCTNSKNYFLTNLKEGATYSTKVTWIKENGSEDSCTSKTVRFDTAPAAPVEVHVENYPSSPHDSILVYFKDTNRGRTVTHEVTVEGVTGNPAMIEKTTSNRKLLVEELEPGVTYSVAVATKEGAKKSEKAYYDTPVMTYPAIPEDVELTYENGKMKFTWLPLDIKPLHYEVRWEANGVTNLLKTEEQRFILNDVKLSTMYRFKVAAVNKAGRGYFSEEETYQTEPAPPQNVRVQRNALSPTSSFIVNYEDTDTLRKRYEVFATSLDGEVISHVESDTCTAVLHGLPAGRSHYVYVVAVYGEKSSKKAYSTRNTDV